MSTRLRLNVIDVYMIGFTLLLLRNFIPTTALNTSGSIEVILRIMRYLGYAVLFGSMYMRREIDKRYFQIIIILSCFMLFVSFLSSYKVIADYWFCIIAAKEIPFMRIIKQYIIVISIGMVVTIGCSYSGLITNYIYNTSRGIRQSLGFVYPTDFAAHVFFLGCAVSYLYYNYIKLWHGFFYIAVAVIMYKITFARAGCYMIPISFIAVYSIRLFEKNRLKIIDMILIFSTPLCAGLTFFALKNFDSSNSIWSAVNAFTSDRLSIGIRLWKQNTVTLFGHYVEQIGNGRGQINLGTRYSFIDMSFMRILIMYGIAFFAFLLLYCILLNIRCIKKKNYIIPAILLVISINSLIAQHFFDFSYNVFLLCFFAEIEEPI